MICLELGNLVLPQQGTAEAPKRWGALGQVPSVSDRVRTQRMSQHTLCPPPSSTPVFFLASLLDSAYIYSSVCGPLAASLVWEWSLSYLLPMDYLLVPIKASILMFLMWILHIFMNLEKWAFPFPTSTQCGEILLLCYVCTSSPLPLAAARFSKATAVPPTSPHLCVTSPTAVPRQPLLAHLLSLKQTPHFSSFLNL